jgi:tryptophan synthase beta chain
MLSRSRAVRAALPARPASSAAGGPDRTGHFGPFGGKFVPETLMVALEEFEREFVAAKRDPAFRRELHTYLTQYAGRPTPLYFAKNLSRTLGRGIRV